MTVTTVAVVVTKFLIGTCDYMVDTDVDKGDIFPLSWGFSSCVDTY